MKVIRSGKYQRRSRVRPKKRHPKETAAERAEKGRFRELERHCETLGLEPWATLAEVKSRFRELAKKFHPDHNPQGGEMMRKVSAAYQAILDWKSTI